MRLLTFHTVGAACALLLATPVVAQQYTGTYTLSNPQGGSVTLVLQHGADGQLTGSMTGNGAQFQVEGVVEEGTAMGAITSADGGVFFEATLEGEQLTLVLIEVGAGNMPDYSKARTLVLRRGSGGGAAPAPVPVPGANPLAGGGGGDPVVGSFSGDGIALTLSGAAGSYQGALVFQGTSYPAEARGQGGRLEGTFTAGGERYPFTAVVQGQIMRLESAGTSYSLTRQGAAAPANPLAGGAVGAVQSGGSGTLMGQWRCQTPQGMAQLSFVSDRELIYNGERSEYQLAPGKIRVPGDWGPQEYGYAVNGDQLTVTNPDGSVTQCQRQQGGAVAAGGAAGGGMEALLQGPRCAYSSSPDGGYSTLYKLFFDGQGRFVSGSESSYSGDPGSAYGLHNDPNAGTYQVTGNSKGSAIHLTFPDGSTGVAYVYFIDDDNGRILELRLNGRHYAPALCQ